MALFAPMTEPTMRVHIVCFAIASTLLAGCAAESLDSEETDQSSAALTPQEWNVNASHERYSATVRPASQEQQNTSVLTHSAGNVPVTPSARFKTVIGYSDHKP
jgi:hypothetical protein